MPDELFLRRKLTFKAHGRQVVFIKKKVESLEHVLMKAFLWALYLPHYPHLHVEIPIGDRYKPDVVALDAMGKPVFWGESGKVTPQKIDSLARRFRTAHLAVAKWNAPLAPFTALFAPILQDRKREAPFDLISFPADSAERFITQDGHVQVTHDDLEWIRLSE